MSQGDEASRRRGRHWDVAPRCAAAQAPGADAMGSTCRQQTIWLRSRIARRLAAGVSREN